MLGYDAGMVKVRHPHGVAVQIRCRWPAGQWAGMLTRAALVHAVMQPWRSFKHSTAACQLHVETQRLVSWRLLANPSGRASKQWRRRGVDCSLRVGALWVYQFWPDTYQIRTLIFLYLFYYGYFSDRYPSRIRIGYFPIWYMWRIRVL